MPDKTNREKLAFFSENVERLEADEEVARQAVIFAKSERNKALRDIVLEEKLLSRLSGWRASADFPQQFSLYTNASTETFADAWEEFEIQPTITVVFKRDEGTEINFYDPAKIGAFLAEHGIVVDLQGIKDMLEYNRREVIRLEEYLKMVESP